MEGYLEGVEEGKESDQNTLYDFIKSVPEERVHL